MYESMNESGKDCIYIEVGNGKRWLLHLGNYVFDIMNTQAKDSMLSRGWYAEPDQPSEVTIRMILRHYAIVSKSFGGSKSPLSKKSKSTIVGNTHEVHEVLDEDVAGSSSQVSKQILVGENNALNALAIVPHNDIIPFEGIQEDVDNENESLIRDVDEVEVGGLPTMKTARHLDVERVLKTIPQVDTKKMHKKMEAKETMGMGGLLEYAKYYPLGDYIHKTNFGGE